MVDDELPPDDGVPSVPVSGPRRSTFTPPPGGTSADSGLTDDDALAAALAQQFPRSAVAHETAPVASPESPAPPAESALPGIPPPPQRQSLSDAELLAAADLAEPDHDTSSLLDMVERELQLRHEEAVRLAEWEQQVRQTAGPDAEQLVSEVRSHFTGVIPIVGASTPPVAPAPAVDPVVSESIAPESTTPEAVAPDLVSPEPLSPSPVSPEHLAAPASAPSVPPSGPELDLALADAPPPLGAAVTAVPPPPGSVPAPPELVEPSVMVDAVPAVSAPTALEALLAAADAATGETTTSESDDSVDAEALQTPWRIDEPDELVLASAEAEHPESSAPDASAYAAEGDLEAAAAKAPRVEVVALEPTPAEQRTGRSIRLFWMWFAVNSSIVSLALGAVLLGLGMSLRQAILAALIGVAVSFLPLGLATLASKWSGQPTMIVSRATFGTAGNVVAALLAVITRLVWAGALLWMLGTGVAEVLVGGSLVEGMSRLDLALVIAGGALVIAAVIAGLGFRAIAVLSAVVTVLGVVLVGGLIALTLPYVDVNVALSVPDGSWMLVASGAILVFSVVGLAWANSGGDVARYQAKGTAGAAAVLYTAFGATIPAFALITWGALLAASNPFVAEGLVENPVDIVARMLPLWYPVPLVLAVALGLLAAATLALYSGGFALLAVGIRASRPVAVVIAVVLAAGAAAALALFVSDLTDLFRDVVTTLAVPVAAWAGIFGAETMIRTRRVHSPSLLAAGGVYPRVRWVNTVMMLVITGVGWGLTTAAVVGLQWQGYLWPLLGVPLDNEIAAADLGVVVALALGLLTPIVAGIPSLRKLQTAEREAALREGTETATTGITTQVPAEIAYAPPPSTPAFVSPPPTAVQSVSPPPPPTVTP